MKLRGGVHQVLRALKECDVHGILSAAKQARTSCTGMRWYVMREVGDYQDYDDEDADKLLNSWYDADADKQWGISQRSETTRRSGRRKKTRSMQRWTPR